MTFSRQKKIMLLGGSRQQVVAIEAAKQAGFYTVLCDYLQDNPGQFVADKFYQVSTTDVEALLKVAKEENIDGVLAYASDPAALPAAIVADKLRLPTNSVQCVEILGVKHKFRSFLKENGFAYPNYVSFSKDTDTSELKSKIETLRFPIVIKPTDSSGSKGVTKLATIRRLRQAVKAAGEYSRNGVLIAEEYIEYGFPEVIGGDIFVEDGEIRLFGEMSCIRDQNGTSLLPAGEKWPSGLSEEQTTAVHKELIRLIKMLDVRFGEFNIEIIIDKKNKVHFLELGPRAGGNMIPIQLSDAFSVDLPMANVKVAMGEKACLTPSQPQGCYMTYVLHSAKKGKLESIFFSELAQEHIYRVVLYRQPGESIEVFDGAGKAIGIVFLHFQNRETLWNFVNLIGDHINVVVS